MISNDVNVIFAFHDVKDKNHRKAKNFVLKNKRREYALLSNIMKNFLYTYGNYIKNVGAIIENQIKICKKERANSPVKDTPEHILRLVEPGIEKEIRELCSKTKYNMNSLMRFKDILLTDFSIFELYSKEKSIGEFREIFIIKSEKLSNNLLNEFVNYFKRMKLMKQENYKTYDKYLNKLNEMKDYEDRRVCAELFAFGHEIGPISFLTFDKGFYQYLKKTGHNHRVTVI